jgi:hypothetical protein
MPKSTNQVERRNGCKSDNTRQGWARLNTHRAVVVDSRVYVENINLDSNEKRTLILIGVQIGPVTCEVFAFLLANLLTPLRHSLVPKVNMAKTGE